MIKIVYRIREMLFGTTVPFRAKLFNVLGLGSFLTGLVLCIFTLVMGISIVNTLASGAIVVIAIGLLFLAGKTRRYQLCYLIAVILVFFGLYPVFFFSAGGYLSGMSSFFVFAVVFTVFMLEGWMSLVISLVEIIFYAALCVYGYHNQERITWFATDFITMSDVIVGFSSVSAVLGITLFVYLRLYKQQQQELKEQTRMAKSASEAKTSFLARMSHEIRTPLNAVLGLSEVELQGSLPDRTRINLEKIYHSGSQLLEIVNDILDISKIESGNFEIVPAEYELCGVINGIIQINIVRIGIKPIEFKLEIDESIPAKLYGDELRIKQILNNLLSNAFKYTEEGNVRLGINWERSGDTALLDVAVEDTGRGIKQEDLGRLFSEYTQFEAAVNRHIEGTGLGLSITRGLVETMGGTITVESEYGKGSVFRISLPQGIRDERPIGREAVDHLRNLRFIEDRNRGDTLIRSYMPYGRVLVVDDLETNLDVMTGLLMPYGLKVDTAISGAEAIECIRAGEAVYDMVFMDHMMPEMDGIEAARHIRNEIDTGYARTVPIIALTANAVTGSKEMFLSNGFTDFISKPVDIKQLDMVLNRWIRDKQSEAVLKDAENQNSQRTDSRPGGGQPDAEGDWLLARPIEGIDFAAALRLYGNSGAAYLPILKSFVTHIPLSLERMDVGLASSSPGYTIEVHGLKGTCNAVGAGETAALARELELASKEGNFDLVRRKHGTLRRQAAELTERLKVLLNEWETARPAEKKEHRAEPERELLIRLSAAAGEFNSNATEEILGKLEQYRYQEGQEFIAWLREQAGNFDYAAMHKGLTEFLVSGKR